jgi:hypothetical protein
LLDEACKMRDEFLDQWGFHPDLWNREVDQLVSYAQSQNADATHFEAIRITVIWA